MDKSLTSKSGSGTEGHVNDRKKKNEARQFIGLNGRQESQSFTFENSSRRYGGSLSRLSRPSRGNKWKEKKREGKKENRGTGKLA